MDSMLVVNINVCRGTPCGYPFELLIHPMNIDIMKRVRLRHMHHALLHELEQSKKTDHGIYFRPPASDNITKRESCTLHNRVANFIETLFNRDDAFEGNLFQVKKRFEIFQHLRE